MSAAFRQLEVERAADACCVRLRQRQLDENDLEEARKEMLQLVEEDGCRRLALSLGPEPPDLLYSVFVARLVTLQRALQGHNGRLIICDLTPEIHEVFRVCRLDSFFEFAPDRATALAALQKE